MFTRYLASAIGFAAIVLGSLTLASPANAETFGTSRNPSHSVHVQIYDCGSSRCGRVVWATKKAQNDARRGSGEELIGMTILRNFEKDANGVWQGRAYVPDLDREFSGSAELSGNNQLRVLAGVC